MAAGGPDRGSGRRARLSVEQAFDLAVRRYREGRLDEAEALYRGVVELRPDHAGALHHLGVIAFRKGAADEAVARIIASLTNDPDNAEAQANLGSALRGAGRPEEALGAYRRALAMGLEQAGLCANLASLLHALGRAEEAAEHYARALALDPGHREAGRNYGPCLRELGRSDEAIAALERAVTARPDDAVVHTNLAIALLEAGRFEAGWREYEWRFKSKNIDRRFAQPAWDGASFAGKTLLVHAEQGLGDTLQFVRYLPRVKARGGRVLLECPPALIALFERLAGVDALVARGAARPDFDLHGPLLGLPRLFGTTLETVPADCPYLPRPKGRKVKRLPPAKGRLRVGLVWAGAPGHVNDRNRSIPLRRLRPLARLANVQLVSLQVGPRARDLEGCAFADAIVDMSGACADFADTATLMGRLDLIVSVDTAPAHLAGALARPVWLLLPFKPDWRWLREREDSPWYPSLRLFRQGKPGDWAGVIQRVRRALARRATGN